MSRYQNGEIIPLVWDGSIEYYIVKGHVSELDFQTELLNAEGCLTDAVVKIEHCYAFFGVARNWDGEPCQGFMIRGESGRGRFMVTKGYTAYGWKLELASRQRTQEAEHG